MKRLAPCDHDECPITQCMKTNMPQEPQPETPRMQAHELFNELIKSLPIGTSALTAVKLSNARTYSRTLERELNEANSRIAVLEKECQQNNQAACLFDRDAALAELAHTKESLVAERLSAGELAKQNHKMREALGESLKAIKLNFPVGLDITREDIVDLIESVLSNPDLSSLTVLSRAEVEKMECDCGLYPGSKCHRCILLERFTK